MLRRYRLCNLKPCADGEPDFRAIQCSEYDTIPYQSEFHTWLAVRHVNPTEKPPLIDGDRDEMHKKTSQLRRQRENHAREWRYGREGEVVDGDRDNDEIEDDDEITGKRLWRMEGDDEGLNDPCALVCRKSTTDDDDVGVVLSPRVHDGTRCAPGKMDMCINGLCQVP